MAVEVNRHSHHIFHTVARSAIAKLGPDLPLPRCWTTFRLEARSRGKEMRMDIWPVKIDTNTRRQEEKERQQKDDAKATAAEEVSEEGEEEEPEEEKTPQRKQKRKRKQPLNGRGAAFTRIHPANPTIPLDGPLPLLFRMGMTGHIQSFPSHSATHKHAHLTFLSSEPSEVSVCFVDQRQFGRWLVTDEWDRTRGPCPLTEYPLFRQHVLDSLDKRPLEKPLCEVMLDQRWFNGIGNYLRAEICHRADVNPFASAANVLARLVGVADREEEPDVLRLCHDVPMEVFSLGYRYGSMNNEEAVKQQREAEQRAEAEADEDAEADLQRVDEEDEEDEEDEKAQPARASVPPTKQSRKSFHQWLRCYEKHGLGMLSTVDSLGRAMWHSSRWRVAGKSKAGSRRPRKGKTISGADREEADDTAAQANSAEETISQSKKQGKQKTQSKAKVAGIKQEADEDEQKAPAASSRKRARAAEETDTATKEQKKRGRRSTDATPAVHASGDNGQSEQHADGTGRRRSSRLTAIKALEDEGEEKSQSTTTDKKSSVPSKKQAAQTSTKRKQVKGAALKSRSRGGTTQSNE